MADTTAPVTLERAIGAANEYFNERITTRMQDGQKVLDALEGARYDTFAHILSPVIEFLRDVEAHNEWETTVMDVRTVGGSWRDVQTYFTDVTGNAS